MEKTKNLIDDWSNFGLSFLKISELACKEMDEAPNKNKKEKVLDLFIPTIFNIKYGIEIFLKCFIVMLEEKELVEKDFHHDQIELFNKVPSLIEEKRVEQTIAEKANKNWTERDLVSVSKRIKILKSKIINTAVLIGKYYNYPFLEEKLGINFSIKDPYNTAFKYPQNKCQIKIGYGEVLKSINEKDIRNLCIDTIRLQKELIFLWIIIKKYIEIKNR